MNTEFLNQLKQPQERDQGRKKKNRGDESNQAIIHIYMETPHVAILNKQKCHFFVLQNWRTGA
jgi:hypothetical protein